MCAPVLCLTPDYSVRSYPAVSLPHRLPQALPFKSFISECFPASLYLNYLLLFILFFFLPTFDFVYGLYQFSVAFRVL